METTIPGDTEKPYNVFSQLEQLVKCTFPPNMRGDSVLTQRYGGYLCPHNTRLHFYLVHKNYKSWLNAVWMSKYKIGWFLFRVLFTGNNWQYVFGIQRHIIVVCCLLFEQWYLWDNSQKACSSLPSDVSHFSIFVTIVITAHIHFAHLFWQEIAPHFQIHKSFT